MHFRSYRLFLAAAALGGTLLVSPVASAQSPYCYPPTDDAEVRNPALTCVLVSGTDTWSTRNGWRTSAMMYDELVQAGWQGGPYVNAVVPAYARTTGAPVRWLP
jgi:hypothetical protein